MLTALPALLLLIGFPHFGLKPSRTASPADSLPPAWKSVSRLALEDQFVLGTPAAPSAAPPGSAAEPRPARAAGDHGPRLRHGEHVHAPGRDPPGAGRDALALGLLPRDRPAHLRAAVARDLPAEPQRQGRGLGPGGRHDGALVQAALAAAGARAEPARARRPGAERLRLREHPALGAERLEQPADGPAGPAALAVPDAEHAAGPGHPPRGAALRPDQGQSAAELRQPDPARQSSAWRQSGRIVVMSSEDSIP